ncbi:MAG TPA: hypothetical protein VFL27_07785 [Candidatus Dormibacteraeota bacterium]|nr:hypothetical protein [Candidatus Dormibacteraeota bacterium]
MRLTWRDATSTALVVVGLAMAVSVVAGWGWPLLGSVRTGVIALAVIGGIACILGSPFERSYYFDPFGLITAIVGMAAVAFSVVGGLITDAPQYLLALMLVTGMLWALATVRHAVEGISASPPLRPVTG